MTASSHYILPRWQKTLLFPTYTTIPPSLTLVEISSASSWPLRSSLEGRITIEFSSVFVPADWESGRCFNKTQTAETSVITQLCVHHQWELLQKINKYLTAASFQTTWNIFFFKRFHVVSQNNEMIPHYSKVQRFSFLGLHF